MRKPEATWSQNPLSVSGWSDDVWKNSKWGHFSMHKWKTLLTVKLSVTARHQACLWMRWSRPANCDPERRHSDTFLWYARGRFCISTVEETSKCVFGIKQRYARNQMSTQISLPRILCASLTFSVLYLHAIGCLKVSHGDWADIL